MTSKRIPNCVAFISLLIGLLTVNTSSADTEQVTVQGVSSTPASHNTRLTAYVTLANNSELSVRGTLTVAANLSDGFQVVKSKNFKLKPGESKTITVTGIRLKPYTYDEVASVTATANVTSSSQSSSGSSSSSSGLSGEWAGVYNHPYLGSISVSAQITQSGSSISIVTSKDGPGNQLNGTVSGSSIRARDASDNQTWTTLGRVTQNYIYIRDYLFEYPQRSPPLEQNLILTR